MIGSPIILGIVGTLLVVFATGGWVTFGWILIGLGILGFIAGIITATFFSSRLA